MTKKTSINKKFLVRCRICDGTRYILDTLADGFDPIHERLEAVINSESAHINWVKFMCISCKEKLDDLWEFRTLCLKAYNKFTRELQGKNCTPSVQETRTNNIASCDAVSFLTAYTTQCNILSCQSSENPESDEGVPETVCISDAETLSVVTDVPSFDPPNEASINTDNEWDRWDRERRQEKAAELRNKNAKRSYPKRDYKCHICGSNLKTSKNLEMHLHLHSDRKFPCEICGDVLKTYRQWCEHIKRYHRPGVTVYRCASCSMSFKEKIKLVRHMKRRHVNARLYKCKMCPRSFRERIALKGHMCMHTGKTIYNTRLSSLLRSLDIKPIVSLVRLT